MKVVVDEKESLSKYNLALQDQVSKYGLLYSDERKEKKEIMGKYENLQSQLNQEIKDFAFEKLNLARRYYFLIGITVFTNYWIRGISIFLDVCLILEITAQVIF